MQKVKRPRLFAAVSCAALLASLFLTACQPTPEQEVVINKSDGTLENAIAQTPAAAETAYDAPVHYTGSDSYFDGLMQVIFDMDVTVPGATRYPIYTAAPAEFTQLVTCR